MQLRYDEDFVEAAVFLCASGRRKGVPSMQITRFHRQREKLYTILDPDERNTAFFKLHLDWFREWGLEQPLVDMLKELPLVREKLHVLAVSKTASKKDEGTELYVNETDLRTGLLSLRLERLTDDTALRNYLRHEFMHLHDMLNPEFGYSPVLDLPDLNAAQKRLARERYRLLWDITIDGRLAVTGYSPLETREQHAAALGRGYSFWSPAKQDEVFDSLWFNAAPRHPDLLALIADPRGLRGAHRPAPGACCPLCDFPTFNWADANALPGGILQRIAEEFPGWSSEQGLCSRCLETYEVLRYA